MSKTIGDKKMDDEYEHKVEKYRSMINNQHSKSLHELLVVKCTELKNLKKNLEYTHRTLSKEKTRLAFNSLKEKERSEDSQKYFECLNVCKLSLCIERTIFKILDKICSMLYVGKYDNIVHDDDDFKSNVKYFNNIILELSNDSSVSRAIIDNINSDHVIIDENDILHESIVGFSQEVDSNVELCSTLKNRLIASFKPIYEYIGLNGDGTNVTMIEYFDKLHDHLN
jgi:hypothetical protein